jgi:diguanylate cyclase
MTPAQIAREALRRLAAERRIPSPENYGELYNEIAGKGDADAEGRDLEYQLRLAANSLIATSRHAEAAARLGTACSDRTWPAARAALIALTQALEAQRRTDPTTLPGRLSFASAAARDAAGQPSAGTAVLREILVRLLESGCATHLSENDDLVLEGRVLCGRIRTAADDAALAQVAHDLSPYCARLEERAGALKSLRDGLARLLRLLVDNAAELIVEDSWVRDQLDLVRQIVSRGPMDRPALEEAEQFLREALRRQAEFKRALREAKDTLRDMAASFAGHLASMVEDTGSYGRSIEGHAQRLQAAEDIGSLKTAMEALLRETREIQQRTATRHREWVHTRERALAAEQRVQQLEEDLARTSQRLIEDHLTKTLNRRGFEDSYTRESARAERNGKPLTVAMLDVDDFKQMNDLYGHHAGDEALTHLAGVIKRTIRPGDTVARYGGEEFLLLLPETDLGQAEALVARLQRELTRHFFLHKNERVLMTFSAGVTQWLPGEEQSALISRADAALYRAKVTGKNKVMVEPVPAACRPELPPASLRAHR